MQVILVWTIAETKVVEFVIKCFHHFLWLHILYVIHQLTFLNKAVADIGESLILFLQ